MATILSIQSHVAFGYVGNRAAAFPLQRMGHDAIVINTVQFSNHTGYGSWTGQVFTPEHIADVVKGIADRGALDQCAAVLTGYMGDAAMGRAILDTVARVRAGNPRAVYCCDPVMGDYGRGMFVRPGIPKFMKEHTVPVADIITPNQFELEFLTGREIKTLDDALAAAAAARKMGPKTVLITSLIRQGAPEDSIEMLLDTADGAWLVATPMVPVNPAPNGAGDFVAAVLLAKLLETGEPAVALGHTAAAIYAVFAETLAVGSRELALIKAQDQIVAPKVMFPVEKIR